MKTLVLMASFVLGCSGNSVSTADGAGAAGSAGSTGNAGTAGSAGAIGSARDGNRGRLGRWRQRGKRRHGRYRRDPTPSSRGGRLRGEHELGSHRHSAGRGRDIVRDRQRLSARRWVQRPHPVLSESRLHTRPMFHRRGLPDWSAVRMLVFVRTRAPRELLRDHGLSRRCGLCERPLLPHGRRRRVRLFPGLLLPLSGR